MDEDAQQRAAPTPLPINTTAMKNPKSSPRVEKEENNWCHRRPSRSSMHQEEATIWSQWRIKLLYAVVVPAAIVYLLLYFDRQHQHQHRHHAYHPQQRHHPYRPTPAGPEHQGRHWKEYIVTQPPMVEDRTLNSKVTKEMLHPHAKQRKGLCSFYFFSNCGKTLFVWNWSGLVCLFCSSAYIFFFIPFPKTSSSMVQHIAYDSFLLFGDSITQVKKRINEILSIATDKLVELVF